MPFVPPTSFNLVYVVWLQAIILFLLLMTPGDLSGVIPVFLAQIYLLLTISYGADKRQIRTAAVVQIACGIAAFAYAFVVSRDAGSIMGRVFSQLHLGLMLAVAILLLLGSRHVLRYATVED